MRQTYVFIVSADNSCVTDSLVSLYPQMVKGTGADDHVTSNGVEMIVMTGPLPAAVVVVVVAVAVVYVSSTCSSDSLVSVYAQMVKGTGADDRVTSKDMEMFVATCPAAVVVVLVVVVID